MNDVAKQGFRHKFVAVDLDDMEKHACATNSSHTLEMFLWGVNLANYTLFVNGRQYDLPTSEADIKHIGERLEYLYDTDTAFHGGYANFGDFSLLEEKA